MYHGVALARCLLAAALLILLAPARSELLAAGERAGLRVAVEVFADRAYTDAGTLVNAAAFNGTTWNLTPILNRDPSHNAASATRVLHGASGPPHTGTIAMGTRRSATSGRSARSSARC